MRLPPLPEKEWKATTRSALAGMLPKSRQNPQSAGNALATLVRHPDLTKAFLGFNIHLLFRSTLPPRLRELAILRVAHRLNCAYEWSHHVRGAIEAGLTRDEIEAVRRGEAADEFDRVVLGAVDELDEEASLSDQTWAALATRLDEQQRMDLVFTVGCYGMLAMAFNTFGVEVEH
ncbi:carboxymuconolactone decarboxylase family protein [Nocardia sp. NBC_01730]|uniref:carboxymuconolactone decarboxylase family protein n=1 Tax=Nocardia sp. NBC_01730 TaxID=2975998 RepID=UPI002E0DAD21|nr:carboxymuconolactone decarboxylase family protein [Nocardia sp. NBC_01730]